MTEKKEDENIVDDKPEDLSFEDQIMHLDRGYSNSQSVVRFLDTKAAAVIGAIPILITVAGLSFTFLKSTGYAAKITCVYGDCFPLLLCVVAAYFIILYVWKMIGSAFSAISPRDTDGAAPSVLFPFPHDDFAHRVNLFCTKPSQKDALEDYKRQLNQMGNLVGVKLEKTQLAIQYLKKLLYVLLLSAFLAVILFASSVAIENYLSS